VLKIGLPVPIEIYNLEYISNLLSMTSIHVALAQNPYNISIETENLDRLGAMCRALKAPKLGDKVMVVSNVTLEKELYVRRAIDSLERAGFAAGIEPCILPDGEVYKTRESIIQIQDFALDRGLERSSTMVALGGGVIGDMTGFAASTCLRGMNVVQVPTTLLAMVDSSIGGKTGVNDRHGKNLIGTFHQPRLVLADPTVLETLPEREFQAGMAEVIKYGIINDEVLFAKLEQAAGLSKRDLLRDTDLLTTILARSAGAKADVVVKDERETLGLRATLNYGHTIGHAIESVTKYLVVNHGEAVALGMVAAGQIAVSLGLWTTAQAQRQNAVIQKAGLSIELPAGIDLGAIIATLKFDKKVQAGKGVFILPTKIGDTKTIAYDPQGTTSNDRVSDESIAQVLTAMLPITIS
jgi:3-dehydroquinate synthase